MLALPVNKHDTHSTYHNTQEDLRQQSKAAHNAKQPGVNQRRDKADFYMSGAVVGVVRHRGCFDK